ncbi:MAG: hypothetical protein F9K51_05350 [Candidatus Dadabacteria bacterium]|nr:MAG: hypothetical protein F9K51_05350 [Candidatus Dadabacteria bacterium]
MFNEHVYEPVKFVHDDARQACRKPKLQVRKPKWQVRIINDSPRIMWPDSSWRDVVNEYRESF